jgi:hypothetical protein
MIAFGRYHQKLLWFVGRESDGELGFSVNDETAHIYMHGFIVHAYHTGTGEIFEPKQVPLPIYHHFQRQPGRDDCDVYQRDMCKHQRPLKWEWSTSEATLQEGWVKDPEGKHRLWLHAHWRTADTHVDWLYNATTLRLRNTSELIIAKF